jgi:uncharacterized protein YndB with AHSA1/START domain
MTATTQRPLQVSRSIDASPEVVFNAWLAPDKIRRWMARSPTNEICTVSSDGVVGGEFQIVERAGDELIDQFGRYVEVQEPNKLVFSLQVPKHFAGETLVTVGIEAAVYGCDVTLTQTGELPEIAEHDWRKMLDSLALMCAEPS